MRVKIYGKNKTDFFKAKGWEKQGSSYVRTKRAFTDDEKLYFDTQIKAKDPDPSDEDDPNKREMFIFGTANANIVDRMQERLAPEGLQLDDFMSNPVLLAYHDHERPIGRVNELDIQEDGVKFTANVGNPKKGELTDTQKEVRSLIDQGILKAVSVGFIPKKIKAPEFTDDGEMTREMIIEQWEMIELSIVSVPANQRSLFDVKNCKTDNKSAIVETSTPKSPTNQSRDLDMDLLTRLKKLAEKTRFDMKHLVDVELDPENSKAKLTFVLEDVSSDEELEKAIKSPEDEAEDSAQGMKEALTLLRGLGNELKENSTLTREIRALLDEADPAEDPESPPKDEEDKGTDDEDDKYKSLVKRVEVLEESNEELVKCIAELGGVKSEDLEENKDED